MGDPYWCPVEGCDYGADEDTSLAAVRSHVNSKSGDDHEWTDLKQQIEQQGSDEEQGEPDEKDGDDDQEESSDDQQDDQQSDQQDMPDDDEYEQQHSSGDQGDNADDGGDDQDVDDDRGDDGDGWSLPIPALDASTMMMVVGLLAVLVILYLVFVRDSSDDGVTEADVSEGSDDDSEAVSNDEVTLLE